MNDESDLENHSIIGECLQTCASSAGVLTDVRMLVPLLHGGHAFVFKTSTNTVLKIFRFPMSAVNGVPPEQLNPYIYFNREVNAYKRLNTEIEGHFPKARLTISITAEHEERLLALHMRSYQPARYRRKVRKSQEELPLKALLLDYVEGVRLTREALLADTALQAELLTAMNTLHQRGVLWGDVKWRNIIVTTRLTPRQSAELFDRQTNTQETVDGKRSLVLLDFSNACFGPLDESREPQINMDSSFLSIEEWEGRRKQELRIVQNMIDHGRLSSRQDP